MQRGKGNSVNIFTQPSGKSIFSNKLGGGGMGNMITEDNKSSHPPQIRSTSQVISQPKPSGKNIFADSINSINNPISQIHAVPTINRTNTGASIFAGGIKNPMFTQNEMFIEERSKENIPTTTSAAYSKKPVSNIFTQAATGSGSTIFRPENIFGDRNELYKVQEYKKASFGNDVDMMMDAAMDGNPSDILGNRNTMPSNMNVFQKANNNSEIKIEPRKNTIANNNSIMEFSSNKSANTLEEFEDNIRERFGITRII